MLVEYISHPLSKLWEDRKTKPPPVDGTHWRYILDDVKGENDTCASSEALSSISAVTNTLRRTMRENRWLGIVGTSKYANYSSVHFHASHNSHRLGLPEWNIGSLQPSRAPHSSQGRIKTKPIRHTLFDGATFSLAHDTENL